MTNRQVRVLRFVLSVVLIAGIALGFRWYRDPERVYQSEGPWIDATRKELCALSNPGALEGGTPRMKLTTPLRIAGTFDMSSDFMSTWHPDANVDTIEVAELAWFCDPTPKRVEGKAFHSRFISVLGSSPFFRKEWDPEAIRHAFAELKRIDYILLVRAEEVEDKEIPGVGRYRGRAVVRRRSDGLYVDGVDFDDRLSLEEFHTTPASGPDIRTPYNTHTVTTGYGDIVGKALAARGITLDLRY